MPRRVTDLPLTSRQIEALLNAAIGTVEDAHAIGTLVVTRLLLNGRPALTAREIDAVLQVLFRVD